MEKLVIINFRSVIFRHKSLSYPMFLIFTVIMTFLTDVRPTMRSYVNLFLKVKSKAKENDWGLDEGTRTYSML